MSRYRKIEVRTWSDEKFRALSALPPSGQGLWFFLLTGPHTTAIPGLFRAGRAAMAEELAWDTEGFDKAFREVSEQGMAIADFKAKLVWLPKAIRHNKPESPNVVRGWRVELDLLPECELKQRAIEGIRAALIEVGSSYVDAFDELFAKEHAASIKPSRKPSAKPSAKPLRKAMPNQEQEQEQEQKRDSVPIGTAAAAGDGDRELSKTELWDAGKSLLSAQGMPARQCGSFVGKLVKDYGDAVVIDAVRTAVVQRPADAAEYLIATCRSRSKAIPESVKAMTEPVPKWATKAGFGDRFEANNAGCFEKNAHQFRDGQRIEVAA